MSKQFYGIKYPFSEESDRLTYIDLNETEEEGVRSMLLHIILTPKGQRLRKPNFGTNLIKYIFEPNTSDMWNEIKTDITNQISLYLPQVSFKDIKIQHNTEEENSIYLEIDYIVNTDGIKKENKTLVKL
jgi:phage baseplate assembly protein W